MNNQQQTVFVVDDEQAARESVRVLVDPLGVETELYESAEQFLEAFHIDRPGCLVTDLRMLGMSGVELQEELRRRGSRIPIIVMTAFADVPVTVRAMQGGAVTLMEKPCRDMELWDAIREALDLDAQQRAEREVRDDIRARIAQLRPGERQVMDLMVQGVANKVIARRLDVSLRTVESRRQKVFRQLHTHSLAELVQLVMTADLPGNDVAEFDRRTAN